MNEKVSYEELLDIVIIQGKLISEQYLTIKALKESGERKTEMIRDLAKELYKENAYECLKEKFNENNK